jgi:hypothetical protein
VSSRLGRAFGWMIRKREKRRRSRKMKDTRQRSTNG